MRHSPQIIELGWTGDGVDIAHQVRRGARERNPSMERRLLAFEESKTGLQVGVSAVSQGSMEMKSEWKDELLVVLQGRATVHLADGGTISLEVGDTAFISAGTVHRWVYHQPFIKSFLWLLDGESGPPTAFKIDPALELLPSASPAPDVLLSATPECKSRMLYQRLDERLTLMLWSATPYARCPVVHVKHELMHFVSGTANLSNAEAGVLYSGTPPTIFVPKGAEIAWESNNNVLKVACFIS